MDEMSLESKYYVYTQPYISAKATLNACRRLLDRCTRYKDYTRILRNTANILNMCANSLEYKDKDIEKI